jgi:Cu(I)/Ag(I) efflux system membrane fusion protein
MKAAIDTGKRAIRRHRWRGRLVAIGLVAFLAGACRPEPAESPPGGSEPLGHGAAHGHSPRSSPARAEPATPAAERKILYWQDPMHPEHRSDKPGVAPDCGMPLVPVYADEVRGGEMPQGAVRLTPRKQQVAGVRTALVERRRLVRVVRTVGRVEADETRVRHIHTKIAGWVEKAWVNFTGQLVEEGQPLVSIYSPELVSTQEEYLLALKGLRDLGESPVEEIASGARSLLESTRMRLRYWDVGPEQIRALEERGEPTKTLTLHSPIRGFVTLRDVYEGKYVVPEAELYTVADFSRIWIYADLYEYEMPFVRVGQETTIRLSHLPGETFRGQVSYVYPYLDEKTRTNKVRLEFPNPDYRLKPGMYADAEIEIDLGERVAVPEDAVMDSGTEQLVFLALADGYFAPRRVQIGARAEGWIEIRAGVEPGQRVVTSANFLVDSESRLGSAAAAMDAMEGMQH